MGEVGYGGQLGRLGGSVGYGVGVLGIGGSWVGVLGMGGSWVGVLGIGGGWVWGQLGIGGGWVGVLGLRHKLNKQVFVKHCDNHVALIGNSREVGVSGRSKTDSRFNHFWSCELFTFLLVERSGIILDHICDINVQRRLDLM